MQKSPCANGPAWILFLRMRIVRINRDYDQSHETRPREYTPVQSARKCHSRAGCAFKRAHDWQPPCMDRALRAAVPAADHAGWQTHSDQVTDRGTVCRRMRADRATADQACFFSLQQLGFSALHRRPGSEESLRPRERHSEGISLYWSHCATGISDLPTPTGSPARCFAEVNAMPVSRCKLP